MAGELLVVPEISSGDHLTIERPPIQVARFETKTFSVGPLCRQRGYFFGSVLTILFPS